MQQVISWFSTMGSSLQTLRFAAQFELLFNHGHAAKLFHFERQWHRLQSDDLLGVLPSKVNQLAFQDESIFQHSESGHHAARCNKSFEYLHVQMCSEYPWPLADSK